MARNHLVVLLCIIFPSGVVLADRVDAPVHIVDWITHRGGKPNYERFDLVHDLSEERNLAASHPQRVTKFQRLCMTVSAADNDGAVTE